MTLVLHIAAKKLHPYFQTHQVTILTNQPLRVTLHKPDLSGWMMKWTIKLSEYGICKNRLGGLTLVHQAYSQGYCWPTMKQDVENYARKYDQCQNHALLNYQSTTLTQ